MKTFLGWDRPVITTMLRSNTVETLLDDISRAIEEGTDAFCLLMEGIPYEERTEENLRKLFDAMGEKPAYVTCYRRGNTRGEDVSDDALAEELLLALKCGARLIDVRGDMYDPQPGEFTTDPAAVEKQKAFIAEVHRLGGEVLMSSHVFQYISSDRVMEIAKAQQERGADIAKIVTDAGNEEELDENLRITLRLKKELQIPSLFLCNGTHCKKHRRVGPLLGSCIFLSLQEGVPESAQPPMAVAKAMLANAGYTDLP